MSESKIKENFSKLIAKQKKQTLEVVKTRCKEVRGGVLYAVKDCDGNAMQDREGRSRWVTEDKALYAIGNKLLTIKPFEKLIY